MECGQMLDESSIKKGLRELNPNLEFDLPGRLGDWGCMNPKRQGVTLHGRHICTMDRNLIPEYNVWALSRMPDGTKQKTHVEMVGWRHTFERLVRRRVPGVTWDALERKFGVQRKLPNPVDPPILDID